jgi:uncharacterized membrane protein YfcA
VEILSDGAPALSLAHFLALGVVAFLGSVLGGVSGFGAGLIVTPFLVPVVGVKGVVPVMAVAMTLGNISRFWVYRAQVQPAAILRIMVPAIPGVIAGTLLYDLLPRATLAVCIGIFLLISIPVRRVLAKRKVAPTPGAIVGVSAGFGLVSGALPGGGIVLMPLLLGIGLSAGGVVGTDAAIGISVNFIKILMFGKLDLMNRDLLLGGLFVGMCMAPGAYGARWLIERLNIHLHTVLIEVLVAFSGLSFIWSAVST